jgi:hypothetical protein
MRNNNVTVRAVICLSLGVALALSAPPASAKKAGKHTAAKKAKKRVLVGGFQGPKSSEARKAVIAALKDDGEYEIGETSDAKPGDDDKSFASASKGATAVLVGTVKKSGLVLSVRNGADGALVQDVEVKGDSSSKLSKNIADTLGLSVADVIAQTKPGAAKADDEPKSDEPKSDEPKADADEEKTDKPADEEEAKSEPASDASAFPDSHSALELEAGLRAVHRSFTYHDTADQLFPGRGFPVPQTYKLPLGPAIFINGTLYPGAFATKGAAANFGITGGYELNFGTKSVYNTPAPTAADPGATRENTLTTAANQYFIGIKARVPFSVHQLGFVLAYGQQEFNLLGDESAPQVPDVWYKFVKGSIEGRFRFDAISIGAHLGSRLVSNTGGLERDWFPGHVKTQSLEAGLELGYSLASSVDVLVGFDVIRYAFNFNPIPNTLNPNSNPGPNTVIAGGATDQFISGFLGVRYSLPGQK